MACSRRRTGRAPSWSPDAPHPPALALACASYANDRKGGYFRPAYFAWEDTIGWLFPEYISDYNVAICPSTQNKVRSNVMLSDVQGMRYAEVAQVLGVPEGTVKSRLFRGRRILQKKLRSYATEMGYIRTSALPNG